MYETTANSAQMRLSSGLVHRGRHSVCQSQRAQSHDQPHMAAGRNTRQVDGPAQIAGLGREAELAADILQATHQEIAMAHPALDRANGCPTNSRRQAGTPGRTAMRSAIRSRFASFAQRGMRRLVVPVQRLALSGDKQDGRNATIRTVVVKRGRGLIMAIELVKDRRIQGIRP